MSPRRKNSLLDDLHEIFLHLPSWSCIPAAIAAFVIIDILFGAIAEKPGTKGPGRGRAAPRGNGGHFDSRRRGNGRGRQIQAPEALRAADRP